jgi:hypothetical protein
LRSVASGRSPGAYFLAGAAQRIRGNGVGYDRGLQSSHPAADLLVPRARDQDQPTRLGELVLLGRDAAAGVEPGVEPRIELGDVRLEAMWVRSGRLVRAGGVCGAPLARELLASS